MWGASTSQNPMGLHGLLEFTFFCLHMDMLYAVCVVYSCIPLCHIRGFVLSVVSLCNTHLSDEFCLLGYNTMQSSRSQLAFRSNILPPPSQFTSKLSNKLAISKHSAELCVTCFTIRIGSACRLLLAVVLPDLLFSALKMEIVL
jgi:hypothetical protein